MNDKREIEDYIGDTIGYKYVCEAINCKIKKNKKDKIKQIESWEEFMDFEMVGSKFKILDVFDTPVVVDGRVTKSKFSKHLRAVILNGMEYQDKKYKLYTEVFGLFNEVVVQHPTKELKIIKSEFDTKISKVFSATIKSMQKEKLIYYSECYFIKEHEKGDIRNAEEFEVDIINALRKKWNKFDNRKSLNLAIQEFNRTYGYHQTWREHYIKVYKPKQCDTQLEVIQFREEMNAYLSIRMKKLEIKETEEIKNYKYQLLKMPM